MSTYRRIYKLFIYIYIQIICFFSLNKEQLLADLCLNAKNKYHIQKIKILIKKIKNLNYSNQKKCPVEYSNPLVSACFNNNHSISNIVIKLLINSGADPNYIYATNPYCVTTGHFAPSPLNYLIFARDDYNILNYLINAGAKVNNNEDNNILRYTDLQMACRKNRDLSIIKLLVDNSSYINKNYNILSFAVENKNIDVIKYLIDIGLCTDVGEYEHNIFHKLSFSKYDKNDLVIGNLLLNDNTKSFLKCDTYTNSPLEILMQNKNRESFDKYCELAKFYLLNGSSFASGLTIVEKYKKIWADAKMIELISEYDKLIFSPKIKNSTLLIQTMQHCNISKDNLHIIQNIIYKSSLIGLINFIDNKGKTAFDYYIERNLSLLDKYYQALLSGQITASNTKSARK